jgi:cytochrome c peroxidase
MLYASGMKTLAVVSLGVLWAAAGCTDSASDGSDASDVDGKAPVADVSGNQGDGAVSTDGGATASSSDDDADQVSTFSGDAASTFEDAAARHCDSHNRLANHVPVRDATGVFTSVSARGFIDLENEFFQDLGTNGRRCVSCHVPTTGWSITPRQLQETFEETDGGAYDDGLGLGAVFRSNDGSNSPKADVSTKSKRRQAYSMLLTKGLIRVGLPVPATAEFELIAVDDPYHFASAAELSLFRRPLPTANLKFDSTVMWDGREVVPGLAVLNELQTQSSDATTGHAKGAPLSAAQQASIAKFEVELTSAQVYDNQAGDLTAAGAEGGPDAIQTQAFYIGINDNFGDSQTHAAFSPVVFNLFDRWANIGQNDHDCASRHDHDRGYEYGNGYGHDSRGRCHCRDSKHGNGYGHNRDDRRNEARRAIARGQEIFNTHKIAITGVSGINDEAAFGKPAVLTGTCTSCHDTPNGGNHSVVAPLNIGVSDASRRTADMPLYTLRNKTTGEVVKTTDPGRALIDGKWSHIGRFKGPMLRNLAPRAPYFHNGFAKDLWSVVDFYNTRFSIGLSKQEKSDLVAFLRSL